MKLVRRTTMLVLIILATSATLASASSSLSGEYVTTVKSAGELNGTYRISFSPGHFTLHAPYDIIGHGTYSISGSRITMHGPSAGCTSAGTYEFKISGSYLSFKKIHDVCQRSKILTAHALKRT
jgi:hypothetical protein